MHVRNEQWTVMATVIHRQVSLSTSQAGRQRESLIIAFVAELYVASVHTDLVIASFTRRQHERFTPDSRVNRRTINRVHTWSSRFHADYCEWRCKGMPVSNLVNFKSATSNLTNNRLTVVGARLYGCLHADRAVFGEHHNLSTARNSFFLLSNE